MADISNSFSAVIRELSNQTANSVEILTKLSDVLTSDAEVVTIDLANTENGNINKVLVPTIASLRSDIESNKNNIESISGIQDGTATVRLSDGTFRTILINTLQREPNSLDSLNVPETFDIKPNYFFEALLNPTMYVNYDLTGIVPPEVNKVLVRRYIITDDDSERLSFFDETFLGRNDVNLDFFLQNALEAGIEYELDEEIVNLPPRENKLEGDFSVIRITDDVDTVLVDGVEEQVKVRRYQLDKLTYNDKDKNLILTEELRVGDSLVVNKNNRDTRYVIKNIDSGTRTVTLELVEGLDTIQIGSNVLSFYSEEDVEVNLQLPVTVNERQAVFVKPIDSIKNFASLNFSLGNVFNSNTLRINADVGQVTLEDYYKNFVVDYGKALQSLAEERLPSSKNGVKPNVPVLSAENFKTIIVNQHLVRSNQFEELRSLQSDKNRVSAEIDELNLNITQKREAIASTNFNTENARVKAEEELNRLERTFREKKTTYNSIVTTISSKSSEPEFNTNPKYRIFGFWAIPEPVIGKDGRQQEAVQFIVEYRYVSRGGSENPVETLEFQDESGNTRSGARSPWTQVFTKQRSRTIDEQTGQIVWEVQDVENSNEININQIEIPIKEGEIVEIRVRTVSEAGFPINPQLSDFSEPIRVEFDDSIVRENTAQTIIEQSQEELVNVRVDEQLRGEGLIQHIGDSFIANENYFAHTAKNLASGFLSNEQKPISVFDKFVELESLLSTISARVLGSEGTIEVSLIDEEGNRFNLTNNQLNTIDVGFYRDLVTEKGEIITKTFFLTIENTSDVEVKLPSLLAGSDEVRLDNTTDTQKYSIVPILNGIQDLIYGDVQRRGQLLYFRSESLTDTNTEFYRQDTSNVKTVKPVIVEFDPALGSGFAFSIREDDVLTNASIFEPFEDADNIYVPVHSEYINFDDTFDTNDIDYTIITNPSTPGVSYYAIKDDTDAFKYHTELVKGSYANQSNTQQVGLAFNGDGTYNDSVKRKLLFTPEDQYLIGEESCGGFAFPVIKNTNDLYVGGTDKTSARVLKPGRENAIQIPIIFQFRLADYFGSGTEGNGLVGGVEGLRNYKLERFVGFDFKTQSFGEYSFDVKFIARYRQEGASFNNVPKRELDAAVQQAVNRNIGTSSSSL